MAKGQLKAKAKSKRKSKAKGGGESPEAGNGKPVQKAVQIGERDFTNLVRRCAALKKQGQSVAGEAGEMIKNAVENKNLDRVAFSIFRKLDAMPEHKLATTMACLDYYCEVGGLVERAKQQGELPIGRPEAGDDGEPEAEAGGDSKVVNLQQPASAASH